MSVSALQSAIFYREVAKNERLWTIRDAGGFPAPLNDENKRAQPFWSSKARAEKVIASVPAYSIFQPFELELRVFLERWVPGLIEDGILVGINWSGASATGFDVEPAQVAQNILALLRS
jgi:Protein of unknown function (DUF2750)